jgi:hypothetical protein
MEKGSGVATETADSKARDAAFEQLLCLAASYSSANGSRTEVRTSPTSEDVALRAYHLYLDRGATHGHDLDDWLQAERQVLEGLKKSKESLRLALVFGVLRET